MIAVGANICELGKKSWVPLMGRHPLKTDGLDHEFCFFVNSASKVKETIMLVSRTGRWGPLLSCGTVRRAAESGNRPSLPSTTSRTKRDSTGLRPNGDHRSENMLTSMYAYNQCFGSGYRRAKMTHKNI